MSAGHSFTWGGAITPLKDVMEHTLHVDPVVGIDVLFSAIVLLLLAFFAGRKFRQEEMVEPSGKLDLTSATESIVGGVYNFTKGFLGDHAKPMFFLMGSLAFFIFLNNLLGLVPGFNPPTDAFNTTIVLGLIVFITTHLIGIKVHGAAYIKHFTGPVWWLAWLIFPIELISHFVRPLSLALRLFGNMTGDHKVVGIFFMLVPLVVPVPMMAMGIFVSFVQAFVFLLLSLVYVAGAFEHAH